MEKLDVMYTANSKYIDIMLSSIYSLIINSGINPIRLHIISDDFGYEEYKKIEITLNQFEGVEYYFYDLKELGIEKFNIPDWRGTQIANARLFFQEILDERLHDIENLLYLDSDTIVVSDLLGLENYKDKEISAVKDSCYKSYLRKFALNNYFNSGVLFFNIVEWVHNNSQDKIIKCCERCDLPITFPDQDILNVALSDKITLLPLDYNMGSNAFLFNNTGQKLYFNKENNISYEEVLLAKSNPKILHCIGVLGIKPWTNNKINPFNDEFMKYILEVNPDFKKVELSKLKKVLQTYPLIFKLMVLAKSYMPDDIRDFTRKLSLKHDKI